MRTAPTRAAAAVLLAGAVLATPRPAGAQDPDTVRVVHIVVDGLHPSQVGPDTPVLAMLRSQGTWYEQARAVMVAETLPNHVAMATGTYPQFNGIPGNGGRVQPGDQQEADPDLRDPANLEADTFVTAIERACPDLRTATVMSKGYLYGIFTAGGEQLQADFHADVRPFLIPISDHAPDTVTTTFVQEALNSDPPPDYLFANLGDVDRSGHVDVTGWTGEPAFQRAVIQQTDALIGGIVATLQARGLWESTVLVISSDHSMDWSTPPPDPSPLVDVAAALEADPRTAGRFFVSEQGGAAFVYLFDPGAADRDQVLADARSVLLGLDGVDEVLYREPNPLDPGADLDTVHPAWRLRHHRAGELLVTVAPGRRVGSLSSNPIPGTHGHTITRHAVALITGGWEGLAPPTSVPPSDPDAVDPADDTEALPEQAEQVDYAPTFGWLLGVPDPGLARTGAPQWRGRVLTEAFDRQPAPRCVAGGSNPAPPSPPASPPPEAPAPLPATGAGAAVAATLVLAAVWRRRR